MPTGYVVYISEHLRDGREESAKAFGTLQGALDWVNKMADSFFGKACTFRLFEMGKEIPLQSADVEEAQSAKVKRRFEVVAPFDRGATARTVKKRKGDG